MLIDPRAPRGRRPKTAKLPLAADCAHEQAPGSEVAAAAPTVEEIVTIAGNATNLVIKSRWLAKQGLI